MRDLFSTVLHRMPTWPPYSPLSCTASAMGRRGRREGLVNPQRQRQRRMEEAVGSSWGSADRLPVERPDTHCRPVW